MKKTKKQAKKHSKKDIEVVKQRKMVTLQSKLHDIYAAGEFDTVCCRQCTCCRVACPQMKYCEATVIIDNIWKEWSKEDKKSLLVNCVKYFFSDSLIKPCLLLDDNKCRIYEDRPLNCRLYGLWPKELWDKRVERFSEAIGIPKEKLPLNTQCSNVKRCNGLPALTEEDIQKFFRALDGIDATIGIDDKKIKSAWNYRTLHDWILLRFWGEDTLVKWTNILLVYSIHERALILEAFDKEVSKIIDGMDGMN